MINADRDQPHSRRSPPAFPRSVEGTLGKSEIVKANTGHGEAIIQDEEEEKEEKEEKAI